MMKLGKKTHKKIKEKKIKPTWVESINPSLATWDLNKKNKLRRWLKKLRKWLKNNQKNGDYN